MSVKKIITICCFFLVSLQMQGRCDTTSVSDNRKLLWASTGVGFTGGFFVLYRQWYKPFSSGRFTFFDDSPEWLGMDKVGHFGTSWFLHGNLTQLALEVGFDNRKANRYGVISTTSFMTAIEIMDGFSSGWGFSWSDYAANMAGIVYSSLQFRFKEKPLPDIKYSWQPGNLNDFRPELLGNSVASRMLKNYNEQTYWLSIPFKCIYHSWAPWFCVSVGYGANGMLGGLDNEWVDEQGKMQNYAFIPRRSEWKFSLDIDLTELPLRKKWQRNLAGWLRWIKIPAPTLVVGRGASPQWNLIYW